jgi:hypothetical protein
MRVHAMVIVCTEHRAFFTLPLRARPLPRGDIRSGQLEHDQVEGGPPACAKGGGRGEKSSRTSRSLMPLLCVFGGMGVVRSWSN